jgi:[acyl-carrier-protein] S-malonyltransferase
VIAGHAEAVDRTIALLAERGVKKVVKLAVSVPSHSALMQPAADALRAKMQSLAWSLPDRPVIQNADAVAHESIDAIQDALVRQLYLPVRWTECVQALATRGITRIGECGPGKVLAGLCKRIDKGIDGRALATDLDTSRNDWH